jgi:hypothetical protein
MASDDRRQARRAAVPLDGDWRGGGVGRRTGRIADISTTGCFVESMAAPGAGEQVSLTVTLPGGTILEAHGEVAYVLSGMGFGVRFIELTEAQKEAVAQAMQQLLEGG